MSASVWDAGSPTSAALKGGRLIALDRDPASVAFARERLDLFPGVTVLHGNYGDLGAILDELGVEQVDGILIDAGVSSTQLDDPDRGFSFQKEGPLDMRLDPTSGPTARERLATIGERELARVLKEYGDVGPARRIAASIVRRREGPGLETTKDLADAISEALPFVRDRVPEETRTCFMAIRMLVNNELRWLEAGLEQALPLLPLAGHRQLDFLFDIDAWTGDEFDPARAGGGPETTLVGRVLHHLAEVTVRLGS